MTGRPWWSIAQGVGMLCLGLSALGGWGLSLLDEQGDNAAIRGLEAVNRRDAFEAECRYDLAQPVTELSDQQIDLVIDLALAQNAAGDVAEQNAATARIVAELAEVRSRKDQAVLERADAVAECDRQADDLFNPRP